MRVTEDSIGIKTYFHDNDGGDKYHYTDNEDIHLFIPLGLNFCDFCWIE
jgi:hypothetical protein